MVKYRIDESTLTNIANAIRGKLGSDEPITPIDMPLKIDEVYTAGIEMSNTDSVIVKGYGEVIRFDNVNPIEYEAEARVSRKNLIYIPNITPSLTGSAGTTISCNITEPITISGVNDNAVVKNQSGVETSIWRIQLVYQNGNSEYMMDNDFSSYKVFTKPSASNPIIGIIYRSQYLVSGQYKDIQVEHGTVATSYAPYISDLSEVNIIKHGKNFINIYDMPTTPDQYNTGVFNNGDGSITVKSSNNSSGMASNYNWTLRDYAPHLKAGETYTINASTTASVRKSIYLMQSKFTWNFGAARTLTEADLNSIVYWYADTSNNVSVISNIQIEPGEEPTKFEPYIGIIGTYPVDDEGTCIIPSTSPTMVILSDTKGAIIECECHLDPVLEAGKQSEYDRFWNNYQNYGKRTDYQQGFTGHGWTINTFKPKYNVTVSGAANQMFMRSRIEGDLVQIFDDLGLEQLDTSKISNVNYLFYDSVFTSIGTIDLTSATYSSYIFQNCTKLKTIDLIILKDDGSTQVNQWFDKYTTKLEEIYFAGIIGQNGFDIHWSTNLSEASGLSIIVALSTTTTGLSVTLPLAWKERYIAAHGQEAFDVMIATRSNWTILWL